MVFICQENFCDGAVVGYRTVRGVQWRNEVKWLNNGHTMPQATFNLFLKLSYGKSRQS